uniref:Uncharacterized protein n=1 Tax=viral metagenome TaxID=1070528 RepID=A0A6M3IZY9_9ZZZZ
MPNPLELIAPPEMSPEELLRLKSYGYGDVLKEMFNAMGQDIKSNLRMIPESELTPVTEITPEMYQKGLELGLSPEAGMISKVGKGIGKAISKLDLRQIGEKWEVIKSGKPVAKFDNLEDAYGFIRGGGKKPDIHSAYESIKAEKGYSWVEIADLRDKMGITQTEMEKIIKTNPQKYHLSTGDWSLSDAHVRSGAIGGKLDSMTDRPQLLVKVNPLDESKITDLIKKTHKKHYGFSIKEE